MSHTRFLIGVAVLAAPAFAADQPAPERPHATRRAAPPATGAHDRAAPGDYHADPAADIVVTAPVTQQLGNALGGVSVLSSTELVRDLRPTLGETLSRQPGVSATSFGPNASRPVLRGLQGDRVRVLTDGIGSFDVSTTSVDHAVVINPLTADRIEVLRGPAALLFGTSAIGGVVNVIDSRIPRRVPDEAIHLEATGTYGSAANERSGSAAADAKVGSKLVVHVDGSYSRTDDLEVGGHVLAAPQRAAAALSPDPEIAALADLKDRIPNSSARTWEVAGAAAVVTDTGNFGVSVSRYDSVYGVPVRYAVRPTDPEGEQSRLDIKQWREDMRAEVQTGGGVFDTIRFRAGHADYRHFELEDTGDIATTFLADSYEARLELVQAEHGGWKGAVGGQFLLRNASIIGEEKFLPQNQTQQFSLFTLQEAELGGGLRLEGSGRIERSIIDADADADLGNPALHRTFTTYSGSIGSSVEVASGLRIGLNASHTERAPAAEELFARGNHAGTQAFELGNPDFVKERSNGLEATLRGHGAGYSFGVSAYHSWYKDFIFEAQSDPALCEAARPGEVEFACFVNAQADARYYGIEVEGSLNLARIGGFNLLVDGTADYVHARIKGLGPAPRIPPLRVLGGVEARSDGVEGRVEVEWSDKQDRVTAFETPTDGFVLTNASLTFHPLPGNRATSIILSANNIFDVVARRHASFLKDYAPLAGRDLRASLRLSL